MRAGGFGYRRRTSAREFGAVGTAPLADQWQSEPCAKRHSAALPLTVRRNGGRPEWLFGASRLAVSVGKGLGSANHEPFVVVAHIPLCIVGPTSTSVPSSCCSPPRIAHRQGGSETLTAGSGGSSSTSRIITARTWRARRVAGAAVFTRSSLRRWRRVVDTTKHLASPGRERRKAVAAPLRRGGPGGTTQQWPRRTPGL